LIAACGYLAASLGLAETPVGEFTAMATVQTDSGERSMGVNIIVTNPMTLEQAQPLKNVLEKGGQQALAAAIRGGSRGTLRLGAMDYPIDLVIADKTQDGYKFFVVTARSLKYEETQEGTGSDHPFSIAVFEVPDFGSGDGKLMTKASLAVDGDGHVRADQFENRSGVLKDVKRRSGL
jgi:hypothetical protein